ncbi:MAG: sugar phosphate isomerase/epimerase, partial [Armatimonadetes bacterium]|nr:sugar phosphate isomerase/epimerase [Armatimonadota bacterium]
YLECFPGQKISAEIARGFDQNCPEGAFRAVEAKLAESGVKLVAFGVTGIPGDEAGARKLFDFAKRFGLIAINAEFGRDVLPLLDKLTEEYGIRVGIHNHPKRDNYELWSPDNVLAMFSDHGPLVGSCADTGHWPRSGLDAVECLRKLAGRVMSLHLKDLTRDGMHDVPFGTGDYNARGQLAELKLMNFTGPISIEYEWTTDHLDDDVAKCVKWMHATVAALAAGK